MLIEKILPHIKPGIKLLDLGAGEGKQAKIFAQKGAKVFAVDKILPEERNSKIVWVQESIENYIKNCTEKFHIIFCKNVIQFLDKDYVLNIFFSLCRERLETGGILAIRTFFKDPHPPFEKLAPSLYTKEEIISHLALAGKILYADQYEKHGLDMRGVPRKFFNVDIIYQKGTD